jgi:hypothetical protein
VQATEVWLWISGFMIHCGCVLLSGLCCPVWLPRRHDEDFSIRIRGDGAAGCEISYALVSALSVFLLVVLRFVRFLFLPFSFSVGP